jgi:hypothetical protein
MLYFGRVGSSWRHCAFFGSSWGKKVITPLFLVGKHLVRCRRRSGAPFVASVAALAVLQRFKHVVSPDL